jgi:hypothetical protein
MMDPFELLVYGRLFVEPPRPAVYVDIDVPTRAALAAYARAAWRAGQKLGIEQGSAIGEGEL